jgi:hypothetical protein
MAALNGFNAAEVDPTDSFTPVPAGDYPVVIVESEMKDTRDGTGQYLQFVLEVIEGPMKGRKLWDRLNLVNKNSTAVEIAQKALSQICHAVNVMTPNDSAELHGKPLQCSVVVKEDPQYGPRNEVKGYKPIASTATPAPAAEATPAATMPPPSAAAGPQVSASPWAR